MRIVASIQTRRPYGSLNQIKIDTVRYVHVKKRAYDERMKRTKSKTKKTTAKGPLARSGAVTLSLGRECRDQIRVLIGRHVTLDGTAATSGSAAVRDLVQRAYDARKRR